jgi:ElaB/YqjD/DUF883 family membrane-anchored ribosome-binding protein
MSRMGENAGNTGNEGQGAKLGETATQVGQNIREMGSQVRDMAGEKYTAARDAATEKYNQLRDQASTYYEQGRERATEWEQSLEQYVHEKPIQAVMIAAGVGVLLGLLWKRS